MQSILEICSALASSLDLPEVLTVMLQLLFKIFNQADHGYVLLEELESGMLRTFALKYKTPDDEVRISRTILRQVMEHAQAIVIADVMEDHRFDSFERDLEVSSVQSLMCVPLVAVNGTAMGVIYLSTLDISNPFSSDDLDLLVKVSAQAAQTIETAQIVQAAQAVQMAKLSLDIACSIQQPMNDVHPLQPPYEPNGCDASRNGESVDCAVFAPPEISQGEAVFIQVFGYPTGKEREAKRKAMEFDDEATRRGVTTLEVPIISGQHLQFHLTLGNARIETAFRQLRWQGKTASVQYEVTIPANHPEGNLLGTVLISTDGIPCGRIGFKLKVAGNRSQSKHNTAEWVGHSAKRFRKAFASYASPDRSIVTPRIGMLRPPMSEISVFQDILSLAPGEQWEREIYRQIDECDLFLLFWSTNASQSEWVRREWEYALKRQGPSKEPPPMIVPVIIQGPPPPKPPPELNHLHFNDYLMYFSQ